MMLLSYYIDLYSPYIQREIYRKEDQIGDRTSVDAMMKVSCVESLWTPRWRSQNQNIDKPWFKKKSRWILMCLLLYEGSTTKIWGANISVVSEEVCRKCDIHQILVKLEVLIKWGLSQTNAGHGGPVSWRKTMVANLHINPQHPKQQLWDLEDSRREDKQLGVVGSSCGTSGEHPRTLLKWGTSWAKWAEVREQTFLASKTGRNPESLRAVLF